MRFRALIAALLIAAFALLATDAFAQQAPINPANLPSPLPTNGITDTGGVTSSSGSASVNLTTAYAQGADHEHPSPVCKSFRSGGRSDCERHEHPAE